MPEPVLGVDACKGGWVGVRLSDGSPPEALVESTIGRLVEVAGPVAVLAIDIPIGLSESGWREADGAVRKLLGQRRSSVFATPVRQALEALDFGAAGEANAAKTEKKISKQAFALAPKILQVDAWLREDRSRRAYEVHPEVSFAHMGEGGPLPFSKKTWAGFYNRLTLLEDEGIHLGRQTLDVGSRVGVDDMLDAAAAAWTARRIRDRQARCYPEEPEPVTEDMTAAIWA